MLHTPRFPSKSVQEALLARLIAASVHGRDKPALLTFLFSRSIRHITEEITAGAIKKQMGAIQSQSTMTMALSRLRGTLKNYFDAHPEESIRVDLQPGSHVLVFDYNRSKTPCVDGFWAAYLESIGPTLLYYTEPQFFRGRDNTYFRNAEANERERLALMASLVKRQEKDLIPSYSFVTSGVVAGMAKLCEFFSFNQATLRAIPLPSDEDDILPDGDHHVIVLGTPTALQNVIASVEGKGSHLPMRTKRWVVNGAKRSLVSVKSPGARKAKTYIDEDQFVATSRVLTKFGVVTRCVESSGRVITLLAEHSRTIQGMVEVLTEENRLKPQLHTFSPGLATQFQARFEMKMSRSRGLLGIEERHIREVYCY